MDNADNLIKATSILDGNNINLHSANADGLKATGDVAITSDNSLTLNGNIESENIALTAGKDLTSDKTSVLKANKGLDMRNAANNFEGLYRTA